MDSPASHRISVPGGTQVPDGSWSIFAYGTVTLFGRLSHTILLTDRFVTSQCWILQPQPGKPGWFGLIPVRSPLLRELFLFLWLLRCFSSPGYLLLPMCSVRDTAGSPQLVSQFGYPRIGACTRLPEAFRSVPRPSSALIAKASTVSS